MEAEFLKTSESRFFEKYFDMFCIEGEEGEYLLFADFTNICIDSKKFNPHLLPNIFDTIKRRCRDKLRNKEDEIQITRHDFFYYIDEVIRTNDKTENENDPELMEIFNILAKEGILNKKYFSEVLTSFELPLVLEEFLAPVRKKDDITFPDFCALFKRHSRESDLLYRTFASSFYNVRDFSKFTQGESFPIKFNSAT